MADTTFGLLWEQPEWLRDPADDMACLQYGLMRLQNF